jgi:hypothetical protein
MGRNADSDVALRGAIDRDSNWWPVGIARVYAFRGEFDSALQYLERAHARMDPELYILKGDPFFRKIEGDARYKAFLRKMNLPE